MGGRVGRISELGRQGGRRYRQINDEMDPTMTKSDCEDQRCNDDGLFLGLLRSSSLSARTRAHLHSFFLPWFRLVVALTGHTCVPWTGAYGRYRRASDAEVDHPTTHPCLRLLAYPCSLRLSESVCCRSVFWPKGRDHGSAEDRRRTCQSILEWPEQGTAVRLICLYSRAERTN